MATQSPPIPPKLNATPAPSLTIFAAFALGVVVLGGGAVLYFFNPSSNGFYPICLFHRLTGLNCPGCGGTRSAYALLHGNLLHALKENALFVLLLLVIALRGVWWARGKFFGKPVGQFFPAKSLWWLLVIAAIFTVLRNLPTFAFLSP